MKKIISFVIVTLLVLCDNLVAKTKSAPSFSENIITYRTVWASQKSIVFTYDITKLHLQDTALELMVKVVSSMETRMKAETFLLESDFVDDLPIEIRNPKEMKILRSAIKKNDTLYLRGKGLGGKTKTELSEISNSLYSMSDTYTEYKRILSENKIVQERMRWLNKDFHEATINKEVGPNGEVRIVCNYLTAKSWEEFDCYQLAWIKFLFKNSFNPIIINPRPSSCDTSAKAFAFVTKHIKKVSLDINEHMQVTQLFIMKTAKYTNEEKELILCYVEHTTNFLLIGGLDEAGLTKLIKSRNCFTLSVSIDGSATN